MNDLVAFIADICAILLFVSVAYGIVEKHYKRYRYFLSWQLIVALLIKSGIVIGLSVFLNNFWLSLSVSAGMSLAMILISESVRSTYNKIIDEQKSILTEAIGDGAITANDSD